MLAAKDFAPVSLFDLPHTRSPPMNAVSRFIYCVLIITTAHFAAACEAPCESCARPVCVEPVCVVDDSQPSWIFRRSTYSHDPETGARVAQYMRTPPVEPLEDERNVTSRYRRIQTNLRGTNGSNDTTYEVQAWGNGRGGIDAEWERFHDAWKESYLQNGYYNGPAYGGYPNAYGNGYGNGYRYGGPGNGFPGGGGWNGPFPGGNWGQQGPWQNHGGPNNGHNNNGGGPHNGGPNNGGQHGNGP
jgi:hypothetical protein